MKKFLQLSFILMFAFTVSESWAQERSVSGKVTSVEDGSTLPGVNVVLKGTTNGTVTDFDGNYKLSIPSDGGVLVFSFIGLTTEEVEVGTRSVIDLQMSADVTQLSEVVITALGTKQNARDVTYANQTVKAEDLLTSPNKNALEALRGKTAGVKITTGSGSVGASSRIVLRGEASLTGNNNALIVVDGIPIDNSSTIGGEQRGEAGYTDFGNRFNDFDPNNIESVTILKGPSATSLYGSRGASGVILITTKGGTKDKFTINFNSTSSIDKAYVLLERQDKYGQGLINPDGSNTIDSGENFSWGAPFDGVVRPWTSPVDIDGDGTYEYLSRPYSAVEDQLQDFFNIGHTYSNTISFSGGNEKATYYASYGNVEQEGILDNTDYSRHSFTVNSSANLSKKFKSSLNLNYSFVDQNTASEGSRAFEGQNAYANAIQSPTSIPFTDLRDYNSPYHDFGGFYGSYTVNPYFVLNEYVNNAKVNNFLANLSFTYNPIEDLTLSTRIGTNYVTVDAINAIPIYQYEDQLVWNDDLTLVNRGSRQGNAGYYSELIGTTRTIDWTSTAAYTRDLTDRLRLNSTVGLNFYDVQNRSLFGESQGGLIIPGVYNLGNSASRAVVSQTHNQRRIIGLLGNFSFAWDDKIFLEYSARNDWSSTLPVDNQSFFYHSVGVSAVISDYLNFDDSTPITYLKLRISYGTTGKDASIHLLDNLYTVNPVLRSYQDVYSINAPLGGQTGITKNGLIGNNTLKPELTTTAEIGADVNFLKDRIQLAYTYYNQNSTEQIVLADLGRSTGYSQTAVNIGELKNIGHEISATFIPLSLNNGLKWEMNVTWSKNISEVTKISDQTDELTIYDTGRGVSLRAEVGEPFGVWKGQVPILTPTGETLVDANGNIQYTTDPKAVGSVQPDWLGSINNTISYKGFSFGFVLDKKQGGDIYSLTKAATEFNGTSLTSLIGDRKPFIIPNSVVQNIDGSFSPNTTPILADAYLADGNYTKHILDGSFLKLREVTFGYNLPKSVTSKLKLKSASVKLFAKNLKFWLADENVYGDPEVNGPSGPTNAQGVESSQTPPSKSYGINLNITL